VIVDSHAHIFPPLGGPSGFASRRDHTRYLQHQMAGHHMPTRRTADNAITSGETLLKGDGITLDGLTDVDFRGGGFGRLAWIFDGERYHKQYLPPTLTQLSSPPELMVAQMDYIGVDKAVLQTGHLYGRLNRYISNAVKQYPERFWGLAMIDEWRADQHGQLRTLERAIGNMGLHGLWFQTGNLAMHGRGESFDDPIFEPFWDRVRDMHIPVYLNVTPAAPGPEPYLAELAAFGRWLERYGDLPVLYPHGLALGRFMKDGRIEIPEEAWTPLENSNIIVELLIPIFQGAIWEYPYTEAQPILREYFQRLGPDRLAWGSDMPNVERHCTYRQSLDYLRNHCDFISEDDMEKICGGNVTRLFAA
jgi:predicted TIM-barrel fold metal-dependent hydrolase